MIYEWFRNIEFAYPHAFFLLLVIPVMTWWYISMSSQKQGTVLLSTVDNIPRTGSWKLYLRHLPFALRLLCIIFLVAALARPQTRNEEQIVTGEGVDIMLCMDVSGSMLAQDFTPNRLEAMKQVAAEFVDKRPTDRVGLVLFAGESFTACPLTTDKVILKAQIFNAQSNFLADGTAIGDGLASSVDRLRNSQSKSKVVILLTDGEDQGGLIDPLAAKEIAKSMNIRVYTIGMGTEGFAPAPSQSRNGPVVMQRQKVNLNEGLLRDIAAETGGLYFRARDNSSLKTIYTEIDQLEKTRVEVTKFNRYTEKFFPLAVAAAICLLLELLLRYTLFRKFP